nr:hypothetical protein [Tanacetum cinerariifolium]
MQTQTSNTLHNAIMEAGSKDRPELGWKEKPILDSEGNPTTATQQVFETYKNVTQEIRDQLNAEAEVVQIILTRIDNDIYSTVDAFSNACEMWKAIERLKQGESINIQDLETNLFWEFRKFTSLDGELLESYYSRFYKMMNELTRNQCKVTNHQVNVQFLLQLYQNGRGSSMVQKFGIQCYNCKEYGHGAREYQKPKRAKDEAYHREKMLLSHYMYMAKLQQVSPDVFDSGPIFNTEPEQKIDQNDEDVDFAKERELLASLIAKLKCEIDESKNRKSEIADFKNKNKSLTEANNKLSEVNDQLYADFKKLKAELQRRNCIEYASEMELEQK